MSNKCVSSVQTAQPITALQHRRQQITVKLHVFSSEAVLVLENEQLQRSPHTLEDPTHMVITHVMALYTWCQILLKITINC